MSENAFEWDNVRELVDLDGHIEFARQITRRYSWQGDTGANIARRLAMIDSKQADRCLNISIVGEFNAGKSTMINALTGIDLLVSRVIQGTTVANTILEHAPCHAMSLVYKDGRQRTLACRDIDDLRAQIPRHTTDPDVCRGLRHLRVGMPSEFLRSGYRIIDTPGVNSLEGWHEELTVQGIAELSDISIILSPVDHVCSSYLLDFIEENMADTLPECIFVVTKMDIVAPSERKDVLQFVRSKLRGAFGSRAPLVLPFSSFALQGIGGGIDLRMQTEDALQKILEHTERNRRLAQLKKLTSLSRYMFTALADAVDASRREAEQRLDLLRKSRQADLSPFVTRQKQILTDRFIQECARMQPEMEKEAGNKVASVKGELKNKILRHQATIASGVSDYVKGPFIKECTEQSQKITGLSRNYFDRQKKLYEGAMKDFATALGKEFAQLRILDMKPGSDLRVAPNLREANVGNLSAAMSELKSCVARENFAFLGGAGAGALIGTAILPGIGTAVGAFLGFMSGAATSPDVNKVKADVIKKIDAPLDSYLNMARNEVSESFTANRLAFAGAISDNLDRYVTEYKGFIDRKITEQQSRQAELETRISAIGRDLQMIDYRKQLLENHLNQYQSQND